MEVLSEGRSRSRSGRDSSVHTSSSQRRALEIKEALEFSKARTIYTTKADALQQQLAFEEVQEENRKKEQDLREETQRKMKRLETQNEMKRLRESGDIAALEAAARVHEEDETQRNSFIADPGQGDRDLIQPFRSCPSSEIPGIGNLSSSQGRTSPVTIDAGVGAASLGGFSRAKLHRAPANGGILASALPNSVTFREPDGHISHPGEILPLLRLELIPSLPPL